MPSVVVIAGPDQAAVLENTSAAKSVEIVRYTDEEGLTVFDEALWNQIKR